MNIYIWEDLEGLTTAYHDGGGLVIITNRAPQEAWDTERAKPQEYEWTRPPELALPPADHVYESSAEEEQVILFPNSGCC